MADINVLVVVDTRNVTKDNLKYTVVLVDDNRDKDTEPDKEGSESFLILAKNGDTVRFRITAVDMKTQVSFEQFSDEESTKKVHCFQPLPFLSNDWTGTVIGEEDDKEDFSITFNVEGNVHNPFTLDPGIKIKGG